MTFLFVALFLTNIWWSTTVAYDGKKISADSQITHGHFKEYTGRKLVVINRTIVGCAGLCDDIDEFKSWYRNPKQRKPMLSEAFSAMVITPSGCFVYEGPSLVPQKVAAPYAVGSGSELAIAAMKAGATSKEAIEIVEDMDIYTGGPVQTMELKDIK